MLDVGQRQLGVSRSNLRLQFLTVGLGTASVAVALLAWQPWAGGGTPARASVSLDPGAHDALVPKGIRRIPAPPAYAPSSEESRCEAWWHSWFGSQHAAETTNPTVRVAAPAAAAVSVVGATVRVFRSYVPKHVAYIHCANGAGPNAGTLLYLNLDNPLATPEIVADDGSETPLAMPNAVIDVRPGQTEYIALTPRGGSRMYEWKATLRLVVDQHEQKVPVGSKDHPLRSWLGAKPGFSYTYSDVASSWQPIP